MPKPIRSDRWYLLSNVTTTLMAVDTVAVYRRAVNALAGVFLTHWPQVSSMRVEELESLFHDTKKTPGTKYGAWFKRNFPKMPSYLRRAATHAAHGAVSSFMTRYRSWQAGDRRMRVQRPPVWGQMNVWPTLYAANGGKGAMIRHDGDTVRIKLFDAKSGDWLWCTAAVVRRGKRDGISGAVPLSPALIVEGGRLSLSQPYELSRKRRDGNGGDRVCSVDLGINKQAVCSIVDATGTVISRTFIHLGAHIDRRDKALQAIRTKAAQTMGAGGKLSKGFCSTLYERAHGLNKHMARELSRWIISFAEMHGVTTLVFEDLKYFRPKGGAKRSNLKQRFHGWLHRLLVKQVEQTAEEKRLRVGFVYARGTSSWAYDGSGKVVRDRFDYGYCRFKTGKLYDCDLSASYNIAARWFARCGLLPTRQAMDVDRREAGRQGSPAGGKTGWPVRGRRSAVGPRTPVTLSSLWPARPLVMAA